MMRDQVTCNTRDDSSELRYLNDYLLVKGLICVFKLKADCPLTKVMSIPHQMLKLRPRVEAN